MTVAVCEIDNGALIATVATMDGDAMRSSA